MNCQKCNTENKEENKYCYNCGYDFSGEKHCKKCGGLLDDDAVFCGGCGKRQRVLVMRQRDFEAVSPFFKNILVCLAALLVLIFSFCDIIVLRQSLPAGSFVSDLEFRVNAFEFVGSAFTLFNPPLESDVAVEFNDFIKDSLPHEVYMRTVVGDPDFGVIKASDVKAYKAAVAKFNPLKFTVTSEGLQGRPSVYISLALYALLALALIIFSILLLAVSLLSFVFSFNKTAGFYNTERRLFALLLMLSVSFMAVLSPIGSKVYMSLTFYFLVSVCAVALIVKVVRYVIANRSDFNLRTFIRSVSSAVVCMLLIGFLGWPFICANVEYENAGAKAGVPVDYSVFDVLEGYDYNFLEIENTRISGIGAKEYYDKVLDGGEFIFTQRAYKAAYLKSYANPLAAPFLQSGAEIYVFDFLFMLIWFAGLIAVINSCVNFSLSLRHMTGGESKKVFWCKLINLIFGALFFAAAVTICILMNYKIFNLIDGVNIFFIPGIGSVFFFIFSVLDFFLYFRLKRTLIA